MAEVVDDEAGHRLVVRADGGSEAELVYRRDADRLYVDHTEVPSAFRGQGTGGRLVSAALDLARREGLTIVPWCPFARRWLEEHPDAAAGVAVDWSPPPARQRRG
ncbi:MAG: GNAT family N-acetyltransferase [Actinomycetota bacterium]